MKKRNIIIGILGIFFLVSCGPRRYGCGPNRRCDLNKNTTKTLQQEQSFKKQIQNS
jgi:hypothetical protein